MNWLKGKGQFDLKDVGGILAGLPDAKSRYPKHTHKRDPVGRCRRAEIERGSPQIFVYFNEKAYGPKSKPETEQWGQVIDFRDRFPKEGLWWPYKGKAHFEKLVRNHLTNYIRNLA